MDVTRHRSAGLRLCEQQATFELDEEETKRPFPSVRAPTGLVAWAARLTSKLPSAEATSTMGQREVAPLLPDETTASSTKVGLCCLCPGTCRPREGSPLLHDYRFHAQPRPRRVVLFIVGRGGGGHKASANAVQAALLAAGHEWAADIEMVD
eukprot:6565222-Prymnesium_polylepis.1